MLSQKQTPDPPDGITALPQRGAHHNKIEKQYTQEQHNPLTLITNNSQNYIQDNLRI